MLLGYLVDQSAVEDQQILESVIIVVVNARARTGVLTGVLRNSGLLRHIFELAITFVSEEPVVFGIADPQIAPATVVHIEEHRAHGGAALPVLAEGGPRFHGNLFKRAIPPVVEEVAFRLIVGYVNVGIAVPVEIAG